MLFAQYYSLVAKWSSQPQVQPQLSLLLLVISQAKSHKTEQIMLNCPEVCSKGTNKRTNKQTNKGKALVTILVMKRDHHQADERDKMVLQHIFTVWSHCTPSVFLVFVEAVPRIYLSMRRQKYSSVPGRTTDGKKAFLKILSKSLGALSRAH